MAIHLGTNFEANNFGNCMSTNVTKTLIRINRHSNQQTIGTVK